MSAHSGVWLAGLAWAGFCAAAPMVSADCEYDGSHCTDIYGDLSGGCVTTLDRRYLDTHVRLARLPKRGRCAATDDSRIWVPLPRLNRIVWRDVFKDPLALRHAVVEAAAKSQCQAMAGEAPHALREVCAADAFARLSVLHQACARVLAWDESSPEAAAYAAELELSLHDFVDPWDRDAYGNRPVEAEHHFAWRAAKCRSVPKEALKPIEMVRPPGPYDRFGQHPWLARIAARLGSVWANAQWGQDAKEINATARANVALAYLHREVMSNRSRRLPFLLVAKAHDSRLNDPQIDWSELPQEFSEDEIEAATPAAQRLLRDGWQPLPEEGDRDLTWPWAIAPPVVETRFIARRYDRYGNLRWVYPNGGEHWFGPNGEVEIDYVNEYGEQVVFESHTQIETASVRVREWIDEAGKERWTDKDGHEHWIDDDGAERWVDWNGTAWVLLPIGVPLPENTE